MVFPLISSLLRPLLRRWALNAEPQQRGSILLPGLKEKVQVRWGPHAVPHVFAASEHDLFMAQGYLHAQERLWQMDFTRRLLSGRLAEIFGVHPVPWRALSVRFRDRTTLDLDYFIRLMGIRRTARASLSLLPREFSDRLSAYSQGVNGYIESHLKRLPLEFRLVRYEPEPWSPEDCLTIGKGFALFLTSSLLTRLVITAISDRLKDQEAKLKSLFPAYPESGTTITRCAAEDARGALRLASGIFQESGWTGAGQGSNNWVVAPSRSSTGAAILCNDPHLRMTLPPVWYLMHLKAPASTGDRDELEVWGASVPGSPCIYLGHNRRIAWGVTAALCDDADLYLEKIHPENPDLYLGGGEWREMERITEKIRARGGKEIEKEVRLTRHGPVITDFIRNEAAGEVLALRWTAHDPSEEIRALYGVNRARDWDEFRESLSYQFAPTLNYVYADTRGNIGYALAGRIPLRPRKRSLLPLPGWSGEHDWKGYIPFNDLPHLYNPPEGIIATANNRIADKSYPHYLSDLFEPPYRIGRIRALLTAKERLSFEEISVIQRDALSLQAKELLADLRADLEEIGAGEPRLKPVAERLMQWDGNCSAESAEAAIYHLLFQRLMTDLLAPDLGEELFLAYVEILNQSLVPLRRILKEAQSPWFASISRRDLVEKCLRDAVDVLDRRLGRDAERWHWGKLHTLTLEHPMSRVRVLAPLFSIGPFPAPGDGVTVNLGYYRYSDPYKQIVGPSLRMSIDLGDLQRSRFILPSGQSGHPLSPHYKDQTEMWRRGESISLAHREHEMEQWPLLRFEPSEALS